MEDSDWRSILALRQVPKCAVPEHSRLSNSEAIYLYRRWIDHGDANARNYLIQACRRYSIAIALMYCRHGSPLAELIAIGELSFLRAIEAFDAQRDRRFLTCAAYRIRLCILEHVLSKNYGAIADSATWRSKTTRKLRRERTRIAIMLDGTEVADERHTQDMRGDAMSPALPIVRVTGRLSASFSA